MPDHSAVAVAVQRMEADLKRELAFDAGTLEARSTLRTIELSLTTRTASTSWDELADATDERLARIGVDDRTRRAWCAELMRAAGRPDNPPTGGQPTSSGRVRRLLSKLANREHK